MTRTVPHPLVGCDFSSSPTPRKPIVVAHGTLAQGRVVLSRLERFKTLEAWAAWLAEPGPWTGAFDFPFGLPRELVTSLGWPTDWLACMRHYAGLSRAEIRATFAAFCHARPVGGKFAHRATDAFAGSSPSMKWVNPPVAFMLHAGVPRLLAAGVALPGLHAGDPARVALEGYPGLLAREVLDGWRPRPGLAGVARRSYKSDEVARQTPERLIARKELVDALETGHGRHGPVSPGLRLKLSHAQRDMLVADASGDALDAVLCLLQAGRAESLYQAGDAGYGMPAQMDALEGWIVGAGG
ncbi:DUF429 domain-containing protein [Rhodoferax koreense]|uniref:DUF429 domain-containing protein n=1 Tax=Rhodoferax koreensis TaxID=1842727 RepID=A0A1P8JTW0_9BURK|nr:DUF429 domain-containing protein [Rhodoferax koreense]APW37199.1 DUF429 domain-containing protein [Rhodoferax koreense]